MPSSAFAERLVNRATAIRMILVCVLVISDVLRFVFSYFHDCSQIPLSGPMQLSKIRKNPSNSADCLTFCAQWSKFVTTVHMNLHSRALWAISLCTVVALNDHCAHQTEKVTAKKKATCLLADG